MSNSKQSSASQLPITLAMTGASGAQYGLRLLQCLLQQQQTVNLLVSDAAREVLSIEVDVDLPEAAEDIYSFFLNRFAAQQGQLRVFGKQEWTASVASGSAPNGAMVICPCSTGSLSAIACGASNNLIERAADVAIKERRRLILVCRETPLSEIHLENMLKLARLGATVLPASPGFYHRPQSVADMVDFIVARILQQLGLEHDLAPRWGISE